MEPRAEGQSEATDQELADTGGLVRSRRWLYTGTGSIERLAKSVIGNSEMGFFGMHLDGTIVLVNQSMAALVGRSVQECIGRNVLDWLNPEDYPRAFDLMSLTSTDGPPPGTSRFMVAHSDGNWVPLEITGALASDGVEQLIVVYCRNGAPRLAIEEVMSLLLGGMDLPDVLTQVCNVVEWSGYGTQVAIAWYDDGIFHHVGTGLPAALAGAEDADPQADADTSVWAESRQTRDPIFALAGDLDERHATLAASLGLAEVWIVPVVWDEVRPPATITIWTVGGGRSPQVHAYGMEVARNMVELILRWTDQQRGLERAAHVDALTGIANRRVFFDALVGTTSGGAVLYCDLDHFKPVNDTLGHSAGDEVLRAVAQRVQHCVRGTDLVARLGGDEFAVICRGASESEATEVATRIENALKSPITIEGSQVTVGVSIGIAHSDGPLTEAVVDAADGALAEAKAAGRATHRIARSGAESPPPPA
jgi:diguanylate cyclase (GGDEF)-like protein/PAS domain S-box-containing protein